MLLLCCFKSKGVPLGLQRNEFSLSHGEEVLSTINNRRLAYIITWDKLGQCKQAR
jgi:hypothetical protein